jgi:ATP-dependent RNA helicase UAP56/SUB2
VLVAAARGAAAPPQAVPAPSAHRRRLALPCIPLSPRCSKYLPAAKTAVLFGGVPKSEHIKTLETEKPNIVVGTPGRVLDLIESKHLKVDAVKHFILDECDKMLETVDMRKTVQQIFIKTPVDKQVMMFSATLSKEIKPVCLKFMNVGGRLRPWG